VEFEGETKAARHEDDISPARKNPFGALRQWKERQGGG
jgi:hypothetical protein